MEISAKRLKELEDAQDQLNCLNAAGVDNWDGYDFALEEYRKRKALEESIEDAVRDIVDATSENICELAGHGCGYWLNDGDETEIFAIIIKKLIESNR